MSAIALVGSVTLLIEEATLDRLVMPLVSFAAGSLLVGAAYGLARGSYGSRATRIPQRSAIPAMNEPKWRTFARMSRCLLTSGTRSDAPM